MQQQVVRMLFFVREAFPTFRSDVEVLFGQELIGRGHRIDLVMQAASEHEVVGPHRWHGRTVWVGATDCGDSAFHRARKQCLSLWHDFRSLRLLNLHAYDAVQIRDKFLIAAVVALTARRRGLKFFYWLSFPEPESQLQRVRDGTARFPLTSLVRGALFKWLLYRVILPRCDHAFVQSVQMRTDVASHGIDPQKLTPVPMGISRSEVPPARSQTHPNGAPLTLVYLGTLNAQRRLEVLLEMLALLRHSGHEIRLMLIGGGDDPQDQPRLERRAAELRLSEHVEITGALPREAALLLAQSADIGLSPFFPTSVLRSTSPTKLVEYLALGLTVVANDHPEQRRVLRESDAGVCVPWGARHFARGAAWLASRTAEQRQRMGECGRRWVLAHRTYDHIADDLESEYRRLLLNPEGTASGHA
jgi:glycosyltransferase involved in cell wall biosynthesis